MSRYTDEQVIAAIDSAPPLIRDVLRDMKTSETIGAIGTNYRLHIDLIGKLSQLNRDLLIGLTSPAEVLGELIMAGVDTETAKNILKELNEKIFIPVQAAMKKEGVVPARPTIEPLRIEPDVRPVDVPVQPQEVQLTVEPSAPVTPSAAIETAPAQVPTQHAVYASQGVPQAGMSWHPAASVHVFVPSHAQPHPVAPVSLPGQEIVQPAPVQPPPQVTVAPVEQVPAQAAVPATNPPLEKQYGSDPYREPI